MIEYHRDVLALCETALRVYNMTTIENLTREGMQSRYREAFRMNVSNDVQRALNRDCCACASPTSIPACTTWW